MRLAWATDSHAMTVEHNRTVYKWDWMRASSPCFKVYLVMIPLLSGLGVEVAVDYLRLPFQGFKPAKSVRGRDA